MEDKYIVTKQNGEPVHDAVVIRKQDIFAAAGLFGYANAIQTVLEIAEQLPGDAAHLAKWEELESIRDYFFEAATEAQQLKGSHIPD